MNVHVEVDWTACEWLHSYKRSYNIQKQNGINMSNIIDNKISRDAHAKEKENKEQQKNKTQQIRQKAMSKRPGLHWNWTVLCLTKLTQCASQRHAQEWVQGFIPMHISLTRLYLQQNNCSLLFPNNKNNNTQWRLLMAIIHFICDDGDSFVRGWCAPLYIPNIKLVVVELVGRGDDLRMKCPKAMSDRPESHRNETVFLLTAIT